MSSHFVCSCCHSVRFPRTLSCPFLLVLIILLPQLNRESYLLGVPTPLDNWYIDCLIVCTDFCFSSTCCQGLGHLQNEPSPVLVQAFNEMSASHVVCAGDHTFVVTSACFIVSNSLRRPVHLLCFRSLDGLQGRLFLFC
jgi:hypothetical protein